MARLSFKMADRSHHMAGAMFYVLNMWKVTYLHKDPFDPNNEFGVILTETDPRELKQFTGWPLEGEPGQMVITNKDTTTTDSFAAIPLKKTDGTPW